MAATTVCNHVSDQVQWWSLWCEPRAATDIMHSMNVERQRNKRILEKLILWYCASTFCLVRSMQPTVWSGMVLQPMMTLNPPLASTHASTQYSGGWSQNTMGTLAAPGPPMVVVYMVVALALYRGVLGFVLHNVYNYSSYDMLLLAGCLCACWCFFYHFILWGTCLMARQHLAEEHGCSFNELTCYVDSNRNHQPRNAFEGIISGISNILLRAHMCNF